MVRRQGGLRQAMSVKDAQRGLQTMSKLLKLGTKYHCFFPTAAYETEEGSIVDDLCSVWAPGYSCDFDKVGTSFVVLNNYTQSETGNITDTTGLSKWTRIAGVLFKAAAENEKDRVRSEAKREAEALGKRYEDMQESVTNKIRTIDLRYFGDKETKTYASENQLIRGIDIKIATEVVLVPIIQANGVETPDWANMKVGTFEPSNTKITSLTTIMSEPKFYTDGSGFLEVIYHYGKDTTDKKKAGQESQFNGCSLDMRLEAMDKAGWDANKSNILEKFSKDDKQMKARNKTFSLSKSPAEAQELLKKYISTQTLMLTKIDMSDDLTKKVAKDMVDFGLVKGAPRVQEQLIELAELYASETGQKPDVEEFKVSLDEINKATTTSELVNAAEASGIGISDSEELFDASNIDIPEMSADIANI